ncbi:quinone oxidoreductase family protein [Luteipulveratus mongoliensis]|uniref:Alcohol dehydrogenase n=1 Tax=Luteipulveratus mongoliensis TaxID=571913 RepID=A0A0K1JEY7_9MICO|nr:NADP-dependent oxidoreductase [Luteipulveratus mongoliensis]AKU15264.1 alcohol dehydrogenase [Luteipulveratus mongoliensis]
MTEQTKSRAMAFDEPGGPESLRLIERDVPQPAAGQVRIRVRAAGVQPYDAAVVDGWAPPGANTRRPVIPGNEFAGLVDALGAGVTGVAVGDEVLGFGQLGCYAEHLVIPSDQITPKPAAMPWEVAGGFTAGAQTAHIALEMLEIGPDEVLLVHGAAGGVGQIAVQLGRLAGARVLGGARPEHHERLRALGVETFDYTEGFVDRLRALAPNGVDAVLDAVGGDILDATVGLAHDRSRVITLVEHGRAAELGIGVTENRRSAERLSALAALQAAGDIDFRVRETFPLEEAPAALKALRAGGGGKVVLTID